MYGPKQPDCQRSLGHRSGQFLRDGLGPCEAATIVEDVRFVRQEDVVVVRMCPQGLTAFQSMTRRQACVVDVTETGNEGGQAQAVMHDFKERVVPIPNHFAVEFHNRTTPEIMNTIFFLEVSHRGGNVSEKLSNMSRSFSYFGSVLREILEYRP